MVDFKEIVVLLEQAIKEQEVYSSRYKTLQQATEDGNVEFDSLTDYCCLEARDLSMKLDTIMLEDYKIRIKGKNIILVRNADESV